MIVFCDGLSIFQIVIFIPPNKPIEAPTRTCFSNMFGHTLWTFVRYTFIKTPDFLVTFGAFTQDTWLLEVVYHIFYQNIYDQTRF